MSNEYESMRDRYCDNFFGGWEDWGNICEMARGSLDGLACIELAVAMSEVSEEYDCSCWGTGLETMLADRAAHPEKCVESRRGFCEVEHGEMANLLALSAKCGGWWEYGDKPHPVFVPGWVPPGARP